MKKNDLFKAIGICFLAFMVLSWIIPTGSYSSGAYVKAATSTIGLTDLFYYPVITFGTFIQYGLVFLILGGFYGVVNKTGVYKKWIDAIVKKCSGKEKLFLILTICILALVSSLAGVPLALFAIIPLLIAIILSMGYSKMVAFVSTIGAVLVGNIGATYGMNTIGHVNYALGISANSGIISRIILLVILVALLVLFVVRKAEKTKVDTKKQAKEDIPLLENSTASKKSYVPLIIIFGFLLALLLVSMYNWNYTLGITLFDDVYQSLMKVSINNYPIIQNLFGDVSPLGYWDSYEMCGVLLVASLLIGWIYSLKLSDIIDSFKEGAKKMLKVAFYVTLANIIFTLMISASDSSILNTINNWLLSLSDGFNIAVTTLLSFVGSLFYNNFYYLNNISMTAIKLAYTDTAVYSVLGLIFQSIHSLVMLIIPTSFILVAGLSMLDISWKEWLKYIWKYLIQALLIILIVAIITFMII